MEKAKILKIDESGVNRKLWVKCPHCSAQHQHGGGNIKPERLADYLGHRVADCGRGGYIIDVVEGVTTFIHRR